MIDLHLHTTASDGRCSPTELVRRVHAAGVRVFAVTDHDTVAGHDEAAAAARAHGLTFVPGIEITAVWAGRDVHVLGYWIDGHQPAVAAFLEPAARPPRRARARRSARRWPGPVRRWTWNRCSRPCSRARAPSVGRPDIARLLVAAGQAASVQDAFDRWIAEGRPGYVPRTGVPPEAVVRDRPRRRRPGLARPSRRHPARRVSGRRGPPPASTRSRPITPTTAPPTRRRYLERASAARAAGHRRLRLPRRRRRDQPARGPPRRRRRDPADGGVDGAGGAPASAGAGR